MIYRNLIGKLFILFFLILGCDGYAQIQWAVDGAEWHYEIGERIVWIRVKGDTLIDNQPCRKLVADTITFSNGIADTSYFRDYYTYEEDSVIYHYRGGSFKPNWSFKQDVANGPEYLHAGFQDFNLFTCDDSVKIVRNDVGFRNFHGTDPEYSSISVFPSYADGNFFEVSREVHERIGGQGFLFNEIYCSSAHVDYYILKCYSDPEVGRITLHNRSCDMLDNVGIRGAKLFKPAEIYPNPSAGEYKINFQQEIIPGVVEGLRIFDTSGAQVSFDVMHISATSLKISLNPNLSTGVYFLRFNEHAIRLVKQ